MILTTGFVLCALTPARGGLPAPARNALQTRKVINNDTAGAALCAVFVVAANASVASG
ncbi:MAG TPA: hypothetical protein VMU59_14980 [Caulobacteraceae bacterium]|nr:hypothetical protein [Caulobacteraceae bacterium]